MEDQKDIKEKWGTMRLWSYDAVLKKWSLVEYLYKKNKISERHRHRYEVNPEFHDILEKSWFVFSWKSPDGKLVEFIEIKDHPYFLATQAHPEFKSSLEKPHPLFNGLIDSCLKKK
jgi:CTP synthase